MQFSVVTSPSAFPPLVIGDIAAGGSASTTIKLDFSTCTSDAPYGVVMPWSQALGADTGQFVRYVFLTASITDLW